MVAKRAGVIIGVACAAVAAGGVASAAPVKAAGLSKYKVVTGGSVVVKSGRVAAASVACPARTKVLSGGEFNDSGSTVLLTDSYPSTNGARWNVAVHNTGTVARSFKVRAVCAAGVSGYKVVQKPFETVYPHEPNTKQFWNLACPAGGRVLAGGVEGKVKGGSVLVFSDRHESEGFQWRVGVHNDGAVNREARPYLVCGGGLKKYQVVRAGKAIAPFTSGSFSVACPKGTSLLGGGAGEVNGKISELYRNGNGGLTLTSRNESTFTASVDPVAVCGA